MSRGFILHSESNGVHVLRYRGRISYVLAPSLARFIEGLLGRHGLRGIVFDVSAAEAIDSTNFGLLARVGMRARERTGTSPLLVCAQPDLKEFLHSMSFQEIFVILDEYWTRGGIGEAVPFEQPSEGNLLHTMIESHRSLINMSQENRERFEEVVVWLEAEDDSRLRS
jgi:anti-anti-sigma factor